MLELNKIYNMDCLDGMKQIEDNSIDLVLTDPPYYVPAKHYVHNRKKYSQRKVSDLSILEHFFNRWINEVIRVIKKDGRIYIFCDSQSYPLIFTGLYNHVKSIRIIVWDKISAFTGFTWRKQHELIAYAEMQDAVKINTSDGDIIKNRVVNLDDRLHPTQKPEELIEKIIRKHISSKIILDPFIGSGTTAVVCKKLGFSFIGFELDRDFYNVSLDRLNKMNKQIKLVS